MQKILFTVIASVLVAVTSAVGAAGGAVAAQDSLFTGTWTSTDHDGSSQELTITGSGKGALSVFYFDDAATSACGGDPAYLVGSGVPDGNTLVAWGTLICLPGGNFLRFRIPFAFEYQPGDGTLIDETGVTWYRV